MRCDGLREALEGLLAVEALHKVGAQIQLGCEVEFLGLRGVLIEGEQTPLRPLRD